MSNVITELQKNEIEKLDIHHYDALIAYGADMYRKGLINGAITVSIGVLTAISVSAISKVIKNKKSQKSEEES